MVHQTPLTIATIDIGSNAIRLYVGQRSRSGQVRVLKDQRTSIRLGQDAFTGGYIRLATQTELISALNEFRKTCKRLNVSHIRAVGTSALRDSANSEKVLSHIKQRTGIDIKLIDGLREARLLHKAVGSVIDLSQKPAMLLDLGGGSLEVVLSRRSKIASLHSLPLGTVRLLAKNRDRIERREYEDFAQWVRTPLYRLRMKILGTRQTTVPILVGTGGNLRALGKLSYRMGLSRTRNRFHRSHLEVICQALFRLNMNQRMKHFQLRKDRADVILPACVVVLEFMRIFEVSEIVVPNVGLKNGVFLAAMERSR